MRNPPPILCHSILSAAFFLTLSCQTSINARSPSKSNSSITFDSKGDYRIGKGDELLLKVPGDESISGPIVIQDSGTITLPLGGSIQAEGLTVKEVRGKLEAYLSSYMLKPRVTLTVTQKRSYKAYFAGEFLKVGPVQMDERVNLLKGISLAGGLTPYASKRIVIIRRNQNGNNSERFAVDYRDLLQGRDFYDTLFVERGDTIVAE